MVSVFFKERQWLWYILDLKLSSFIYDPRSPSKSAPNKVSNAYLLRQEYIQYIAFPWVKMDIIERA